MKKVLLTGASGFIGRHTIPGLLRRGYEIHAISGNSPVEFPDVISHRCNLLDSIQTSRLVKEITPSHLLHLAWYTQPGNYWNSDFNVEWVKGSLHLLKEFINHGGERVVMAGTCAEYDWSYDICHETDTPLNPSTLYGICKTSLYRIVDAYTKQAGCSSAWGRVFFLHGPYEYPQRLVPSVIQRLLSGGIAECSHGMQIRDFLHVEDAGEAFAILLDSPIQGAVNIASGQAVSLKDVINKIVLKLATSDRVCFGALPAASNDAARVVADVNCLKIELNWCPKYTLDEGLDQTILWWKNANK